MQCAYPSCQIKLTPTIETSTTCPYCRTNIYCSPTCRQLHWDLSHKGNCTGYQGTSPRANNTSALDVSSTSTNSSKKQKTIDDYEIINQPTKANPDLGKGSFGQVKLVRDKADPSKQYAMKVINKKQLMAYSGIDYLKREIKIQKKLDHPHIIKLYHYFEDKDNVYLILEYAKNGNLFFYLRRKKALTEKEAFVYFFQTCIGIDYLHKKGILHRDLKPENLLLDGQGNIKVCDFGWSAEDVGKRNTFCGTVDYMAPEMVQNKAHDFKIDIWSLGILLYELLHGYPPFRGKTANEKFQSILEKELKFKEGLSSEVQDLLTSLLRSEPSVRPGFDFIFNHSWLQKHEKDFGMSVKSFIYDPSKKKDKPEKNRSQSPISQTSIPQMLGFINTEKSPMHMDLSPSKQVSQFTTHSPRGLSPLNTQPSSQTDIRIPNLNVSGYSEPKTVYSGIPSGIQTGTTSPARSRNNLDDTSGPTNIRADSPMKGVNKANEIIQSIFQPRDKSKSPPRTGIFSPNKKYEPPSTSNKLIEDVIQKRNTTQENPLGYLATEPDYAKRKTTNDISVIAGIPDRTNKFLATSHLPSSMTNINLPSEQGYIPKVERALSDNSIAFRGTDNSKSGIGGTNLLPSLLSKDIDFSKAASVSKVDPNALKKNIDEDVPDIKESTRKDNLNFGKNLNKPENVKPVITTSPMPENNYSQYTPNINVNQFSTPKDEKSMGTALYNSSSSNNPTQEKSFYSPYSTSTSTNPLPSTNAFNPLADIFQPTRTVEKSPSRAQESSTSHYGDNSQMPKSPVRTEKPIFEQHISKQEKSSPPKGVEAKQGSKDIDFFIPKSDNYETMFAKNDYYSKSNEDHLGIQKDFDIHKDEPVRMTRVTNILQKSEFSEVDQIMEKLLQNEQNGHESEPRSKTPPRNKSPNQARERQHSTESPPDQFRVTNINKYLASYNIENTEENKMYDMLDTFYKTGKLEENEDMRYPKRKPQEEMVKKKNLEESMENVEEMSFQVENSIKINETVQVNNSIKRTYKTEMSFQDKNEMSFAEETQETKESPLKDKRRGQKGREETHHIQEENEYDEEDDYGKRSHDKKIKERDDNRSRDIKYKEEPKRYAEKKQEEEDDDYYREKWNARNQPKEGNQKEKARIEGKQRRFGNVDNEDYDEERREIEQKGRREEVQGQSKYNAKQEIRSSDTQSRFSFGEDEDLERQRYEKEKAIRNAMKGPVSKGEEMNSEKKGKDPSSSFIVRMVEKGKSEQKDYNRTNDQFRSEQSDLGSSQKRTTQQSLNTSKPISPNRSMKQKELSALENEREDLMKNYRNRLHGLYNFGGSNESQGYENEDNHSKYTGGRYHDEEKTSNSKYNIEEEIEEEETHEFGRRYNEKKGEKAVKSEKENKQKQKRKDGWPEESERNEITNDKESNYYNNRLLKSMDESYDDLKRRKQKLEYYMDDLELDDSNAVSRPSWRNKREIPKYEAATQNEPGLLTKISSLFGCLDRSDKKPPPKTRKGRKI